eukprot:8254282-Prorocentrum_lima.AAC.1
MEQDLEEDGPKEEASPTPRMQEDGAESEGEVGPAPWRKPQAKRMPRAPFQHQPKEKEKGTTKQEEERQRILE